jgi:hypothetical protein
MPIVFKYFWLLAVLVGLLNFAIMRGRVEALAIKRPELKHETRQVLIGYLLALTVPFFLLGILQLAGGYESPFFIFQENLNNPFVIASITVMVVWWAIIAYWVYFKNGVKALNILQIAYYNRPTGELPLKLSVALMLLGGILGLIWGRTLFSNFFK